MQITQKSKTDIAVNCFRRGGGVESYTFDLMCGLRARGTETVVYAAQTDPAVPEYNQTEIYRVNQQIIPKKLRPYLFTRQFVRTRRGQNVPFAACNLSDHADIFVCGGIHLGYLYNMGERPGLLDRLTIRRNRSSYATTEPITVYLYLMQCELTALYGVPSEKIRVIHPLAGTARFCPAPNETVTICVKYGFRDDETVSPFSSTGHKCKGLDLLVGFLEHTDLPVKLAVAGSLLSHPMKNVIGLGFCTNMPEFYCAVDFTVMVPLCEPFRLVGVEPILCGTRVVLFDSMACTEVTDDEAGFFFSRNRPETLAQAVAQAATLKQQDRHKIADPTQASIYNPTLEHHIDRTVAMLEVV